MEFLRVEDSYFPRNISFRAGGKLYTNDRPLVMGILNVTPDSFYAKSRYSLADNYLFAAEQMLRDGAAILDIGGYSSRPGAKDVTADEEIERISPVIAAIKHNFPDSCVSIDTFRSSVAIAAVENGADIINDISGGTLDPLLFETVARLQCPYILMHMKGTPATMQQETHYENLFKDVCRYFAEKITELRALGVADIILDPGFGFAKTAAQNFELLDRLQDLQLFGLPLLAGLSRKSMIYKTLSITPEEALNGTTALNTIALQKGAGILRVHDVKEAVELVKLEGEL